MPINGGQNRLAKQKAVGFTHHVSQHVGCGYDSSLRIYENRLTKPSKGIMLKDKLVTSSFVSMPGTAREDSNSTGPGTFLKDTSLMSANPAYLNQSHLNVKHGQSMLNTGSSELLTDPSQEGSLHALYHGPRGSNRSSLQAPKYSLATNSTLQREPQVRARQMAAKNQQALSKHIVRKAIN